MALTLEQAWAVLDGVTDPEIPVVSLRDMGILRDVRPGPHGLEVVITPTYSGCPAMGQMADDVVAALARHGQAATVVTQLAPAWTTDWITDAAKDRLRAYGIAPPGPTRRDAPPCAGGTRPADETPAQRVLRFLPGAASATSAAEAVPCPRCGSTDTVETSRFGSTACKAQHRCLACREPFDHFKPH
jgi:ring-1,2-phenylacetyl-CoA epoxidase subunit PaaD